MDLPEEQSSKGDENDLPQMREIRPFLAYAFRKVEEAGKLKSQKDPVPDQEDK